MEKTGEELSKMHLKLCLQQAEREECVSKMHLKLCLRLAEVEATAKSLNTPQEHKMEEVKVMSKRVVFLESGVKFGCCRYQESNRSSWVAKCPCCKPEGTEDEILFNQMRAISEADCQSCSKPQ
jgi:hypothetical protein